MVKKREWQLKRLLIVLMFVGSIGGLMAQQSNSAVLDEVVFGNTESETIHQFSGEFSKVITGGLEETARELLPLPQVSWQGGSMAFTIKVDPLKQNYITTRLWGNDVTHNRLYLVCGDKQIGSRHLGEVDMLDVGSDYPFYNDRFFYVTLPLPLSLTQGKGELRFEIRSQGAIWGYGQTWEKYQKDMVEPTRGIYRLYVHTDPAFLPGTGEKQGNAPVARKRPAPGSEVLDALKMRVNNEIEKLKKSVKSLNQMQLLFLAKSFHTKWSFGYQDKTVLFQVQSSLDDLYRAFVLNPKLAADDRSTPNPDWFGFGPAAQALFLLFDEMKGGLDTNINLEDGKKVLRRIAYAEMFMASRTTHLKSRRQYTNQTMIKDLFGIYYCNKGLALLGAPDALPETQALRYLYEAVGLLPWTGSLNSEGNPSFSQGKAYMQLTQKGLTKELGFVGNYGEVLDWCAEIYEGTRPKPDEPGDAQLKAQIEKIALARTPFRYPMPDNDKYNAMRQEVVVGWRDTHYPGDVTYAQRPSWDGGPLQIAATTLHPKLVGYAQQQLEDNQFFITLQDRMKEKGFRVTAGLLAVPEQYDIIKRQPKAGFKLPMSDGEADFVFSDEEDGVVAIKNGADVLYASLYWRARHAINRLARVHMMTPQYDRIATVAVEEKFDSSGLFFTVPDYTNMGFAKGGLKYPDSLHLAHAGELQPIPKIPSDIPYKTGQEHPLAGRANYYQLQYGNYLIVMNATSDRTYSLSVPAEFFNATNLVSGKKSKNMLLEISPKTTVVLYRK